MDTSAQFGDARKELGLGCPPTDYGENVDQALADFCNPQARLVIGESARWIVDLPVADAVIPTTFGNRMNVWGTQDETPPPGVAEATNTVATPNLFPSDFIIRGFQVRILVPPEGRLIRGAWLPVGTNGALPGIPDAWTINDVTNGAFGTVGALGTPTPGMILSGLACWKVGYAAANAYELRVGIDHQNALIRQPLTTLATVEPFSEAEAAGNVFGANIDDINKFNQRMVALNVAPGFQFLPPNFKRLGALTVGGVDVGDFTVSREEDGSPTMWGGPGIPGNPNQKDPLVLHTPLFWPAGHSISIEFGVSSNFYLAEMQRWLSATGGTGGNAGADLNLPPSALVAAQGGYTGLTPTTPGATGMLEQTLDTMPVNVAQQTVAGRMIGKFGRMVFEVTVMGWRLTNPSWHPVVARAINKGAIAAPVGYGTLAPYMERLRAQSLAR